MKRAIFVVALACTFALAAVAQDKGMVKEKMKKSAEQTMAVTTVKGYVVDVMCAKGMAGKENTMTKASAHTKACALDEACAESGFGMFSEGKWYVFDEAGSKRAHALVEKTTRKKDLMFEVSGTLDGSTLAVADIKEIQMKSEAKEKKSEKK